MGIIRVNEEALEIVIGRLLLGVSQIEVVRPQVNRAYEQFVIDYAGSQRAEFDALHQEIDNALYYAQHRSLDLHDQMWQFLLAVRNAEASAQ